MHRLGLGYNLLNSDEQYAFEILENALINHRKTCDIRSIKSNVNIMNVLCTVLGDNPEIIYFNKNKIRITSGPDIKQIGFTGCLENPQAVKKEAKLKKALEKAVWTIDKTARNDREILEGISAYIQKNTVYDKNEMKLSMKGKSRNPDCHNAYGALVEHKAVCDGFSSAYALIAHYFGIRCMIAEGMSSYDSYKKVDHAWNVVEFEKAFYHVDVTWDTNTYSVTNEISYNHFGLDDDEISLDHEWDYRTTPICNKDKLSYYVYNKLIAGSESQIEKIILSEIRRGKKVIRLKVSPGIRIPKNYKKFYENLLGEIFGKMGVSCRFSYMWDTNTRCLDIKI